MREATRVNLICSRVPDNCDCNLRKTRASCAVRVCDQRGYVEVIRPLQLYTQPEKKPFVGIGSCCWDDNLIYRREALYHGSIMLLRLSYVFGSFASPCASIKCVSDHAETSGLASDSQLKSHRRHKPLLHTRQPRNPRNPTHRAPILQRGPLASRTHARLHDQLSLQREP